METITINSVTLKASKTNVPFWAVVYNGSGKATIWDEELSKTAGMNLGKPVQAEIKESNGFFNIRSIGAGAIQVTNPDGTTKPIEVNPSLNKPAIQEASLLSGRDISIIAQCMTKCACYGRSDVTIGMALDMYHGACLSLEQNG